MSAAVGAFCQAGVDAKVSKHLTITKFWGDVLAESTEGQVGFECVQAVQDDRDPFAMLLPENVIDECGFTGSEVSLKKDLEPFMTRIVDRLTSDKSKRDLGNGEFADLGLQPGYFCIFSCAILSTQLHQFWRSFFYRFHGRAN